MVAMKEQYDRARETASAVIANGLTVAKISEKEMFAQAMQACMCVYVQECVCIYVYIWCNSCATAVNVCTSHAGVYVCICAFMCVYIRVYMLHQL